MDLHRPVSPAERILAAADLLFYTKGIRAVGVDAVAAEAGVSKRTLYHHYPSKDALITAYLTSRFNMVPPSDKPAREQLLGAYDRLERLIGDGSFRGCPYVNAVAELGDPRHPAAAIAVQFKEQRRLWYRALLERLGARDPDGLATQLQILFEGALSAALVRGDPALARSARAAAQVLLDAATCAKRSRARAAARAATRPAGSSGSARRSRPR